jgi:NADP-dependent 3-hydroxy acid dehydrogenase YdfG
MLVVSPSEAGEKFAMPPDGIARAIAFAIEQPADVDVNETIVRPTGRVNEIFFVATR